MIACPSVTHSWMYLLRIPLFLLVCSQTVLFGQTVLVGAGQQRQSLIPSRRLELPTPDDARSVFTAMEKGIVTASVDSFSRHLASPVYLNLQGGETGSYSSAQAFYILDNYLKSRKPVSFRFSTIGGLDANPFATGSGTFQRKGAWEIGQVYISLSASGDRWVISQINVY